MPSAASASTRDERGWKRNISLRIQSVEWSRNEGRRNHCVREPDVQQVLRLMRASAAAVDCRGGCYQIEIWTWSLAAAHVGQLREAGLTQRAHERPASIRPSAGTASSTTSSGTFTSTSSSPSWTWTCRLSPRFSTTTVVPGSSHAHQLAVRRLGERDDDFACR